MALLKIMTENGWEVVDLTAASLGAELLTNRDIKQSINTRLFNGNWAALKIGAYGYDRWVKATETEKGQIIPAGEYVPGVKHTLSYWLDGERKHFSIKSPTTGPWLVKVPFIADYLSLRKGLGYSDYVEELHDEKVRRCQRFAERKTIEISWRDAAFSYYYGYNYKIDLMTQMRRLPDITFFLTAEHYVDADIMQLSESSFSYRITNLNGTSSAKKIEYLADAEIKLSEVAGGV